jgi:integrase
VVEQATRLGWHCETSARNSSSMQCDIRRDDVCNRLSAIAQARASLHSSLDSAEREDISRGIACGCRSLYPVVMLALNTGMRAGEIRGLKWTRVDFSGRASQ